MNIFSSNAPDPQRPQRPQMTPQQKKHFQHQLKVLGGLAQTAFDETVKDPVAHDWLSTLQAQLCTQFELFSSIGLLTDTILIGLVSAAVSGGMALERMRQTGQLNDPPANE